MGLDQVGDVPREWGDEDSDRQLDPSGASPGCPMPRQTWRALFRPTVLRGSDC